MDLISYIVDFILILLNYSQFNPIIASPFLILALNAKSHQHYISIASSYPYTWAITFVLHSLN